jgi:hypothetical protein
MLLLHPIIARAISSALFASVAGSCAFLFTLTCDGRDPPTATGVIVPGNSANPFEETEHESLTYKGASVGTKLSAETPKNTSAPSAITHPGAQEQSGTKESPLPGVASSSDIGELQVARQLLEERYKQITDQINDQARNVQKLEAFGGEADQLRAEIDRLKAVVKDMGIALTKMKIELDAAPRVSILQQASKPEPVGTARPYIAAGIGALLGVLLVLICVSVVRLLLRKPAPETQSSGGMRWGITISCAVIVGAVIGGLGWYYFPPKYESTGFVQVRIVDPAVWEQHSGLDFEAYKRNMVEMLKSPPVLERAVEDKAIQGIPLYQKNSADPVNWLADTLQITGGNSELIRISLRNDDPIGLKEIVDAVLAGFKSRIIDDEHDKKSLDYENLRKKFEAYDSNVLEKERQLYNLNVQTGTGTQTAKLQYKIQVDTLDTLLQLRSDTQRQLADVAFRLALMKALQDLHKGTTAPPPNGGKAKHADKSIK